MLGNADGGSDVYRWESGRNTPKFDVLVRISDLLGVSLDWLMRGRQVETGLRYNYSPFYGIKMPGSETTCAP